MLAREVRGWLGLDRQGGSSQSVDQGRATKRSMALLPGSWQSPPAWVWLPWPLPLAPGTQMRRGSREEAETSACVLLSGTAVP